MHIQLGFINETPDNVHTSESLLLPQTFALEKSFNNLFSYSDSERVKSGHRIAPQHLKEPTFYRMTLRKTIYYSRREQTTPWHDDKCHNAKWLLRYVILLSAILLNVAKLSVILLSVIIYS